MRRHLTALFGSSLLLLSAPAAAEDEEQDAVDAPSETEAADVEAPAAPSTPRVPGAKESSPGTVHTVIRGDTLWDLSQSYLGTPWYWPKVWSYNPQIANPHWIYPGNQVRFFPAGDEGPSRVEVGEAPEEAVQPSDSVQPSDVVPFEGEAQERVEVAGKIGYQPRQAGRRVMRDGFITDRELEEAGLLSESPSEALMLSSPDKVYLTFRKGTAAKVGDRYVVFHTVRAIPNKGRGGHAGYLTRILGTVKVLSVGDKRVTARVESSWDEIRRGDLVGPYGEQISELVSSRPNTKSASGFVLTALDPSITLFGEHHHVIVDLGRKDGLETGNTLVVVRQGDPSGVSSSVDPTELIDTRLPVEEIAACVAFDVKEKTSSCVLTRSLREVMAGDRVQLLPGEKVAESSGPH